MKEIKLFVFGTILLSFNCLGEDTVSFQRKDSTIVCYGNEKNENQSEKTRFDCEFFFQLIAALGSLATFGAFVCLFFKDKSKQEQIDKLSSIATVLEAQNEAMCKQNGLISQQVEILRNIAISGKGNDDAIKELRDIEEKKLRLSVKPNLWLNVIGYDSFSGELKIDLNNKGEDAKLLEFNLISEDIELHSKSLPYNLDKGKRRYIFGRSIGFKSIKHCIYEIKIVYVDKLDHKYETTISGNGEQVIIKETREIN